MVHQSSSASTGVGQQFESAKKIRLALVYHAAMKKFVYDFGKNERTRVIAICENKNEMGSYSTIYEHISHI